MQDFGLAHLGHSNQVQFSSHLGELNSSGVLTMEIGSILHSSPTLL